MEADFYVPYEGGHLPMGITSMEVETVGGEPSGELREVRMVIHAVNVGAPIHDATIRPTRELRS